MYDMLDRHLEDDGGAVRVSWENDTGLFLAEAFGEDKKLVVDAYGSTVEEALDNLEANLTELTAGYVREQ